MSTYVNRVIEVYVEEEITGYVEYEDYENNMKNLPEYIEGMLYSIKNIPYNISKDFIKYWKWTNGEWQPVTKRKKYWKMLPLWYNNSSTSYANTLSSDNYITTKDGEKIKVRHFNCICDNGGDIRDYYLSNWGPYDDIRERGIADDISEEAKNYLDYCTDKYHETYVTLKELCDISGKEFTIFRNKVESAILNKKLDIISDNVSKIYSKLNGIDPETPVEKTGEEPEDEYIDDEEYDKFEYIWDEDFNQMMSIKREINSIYTLVDVVYGYVNVEDIRIHYFFD